MLASAPLPLLVRGKVVQPDGTAPDRWLFLREGRVEAVSRRRPPLTEHVLVLDTDSEEWIFPGLFDLHTHAAYNLLPLWDSPKAPFDNRFQWRSDAGYKREVRGVHGTFDIWENEQNRRTMAVFAELQAIAGGTTVLQESTDLERDAQLEDGLLLCRDTSRAEELELDGTIFSVVDFFRPSRETGEPEPHEKNIARYLEMREAGTLQATLAHLAEGRSGFGHNLGVDPYSRREFEAFMAHPAFADAEAVRRSPLAIVHGCGIDPQNRRHVEFLRERAISIVWSPVSNLLLYGATIDVESWMRAGINVALGSDWSPSGSKHVWDEAKFARKWLDAIGGSVADEQILRMVTVNAVRCLVDPEQVGRAPRLGRLEAGGLADLFILRSPLETDDPFEAFFAATDRDVRATIVGGRPIYGDLDWLERTGFELQPLPAREGSAVEEKVVHLPPQIGVDVARDIERLEDFLKAQEPPVKRSNLLSSSDKIYRRRLQRLHARAVELGWSVQQWRSSGPSETPGRVEVGAGCVRLALGTRSAEAASRLQRLGSTVLPATAQQLAPLGLTALGVLVASEQPPPEGVPDVVTLAFYESKKTAGATCDYIGGRVARELERAAGLQAIEAFPERLGDTLGIGLPYYVIPGSADWHEGRTEMLLGRARGPIDTLCGVVQQRLAALQANRPDGLDGALVLVDAGFLFYAEHWRGESGVGAMHDLAGQVDVVTRGEAKTLAVSSQPLLADAGPELDAGTWSLRFPRRKLFPS